MSHESVPETPRHTGQTGQAAHDQARQESAVPAQGSAPKGLLQQMEELMAALNADLSQLDADLQHSTDRTPPAAPVTPGSRTYESERHSDRSF
ncbi:hypothetical protein OOK31_07850 [Streptomyces sp. NBC_00249]|uniref:hypothetical protein n=1 Tax=Streptomyces sp. NBC_00249 TaxID=2975690 RepID=UPI0022574624|nr:hypothetical protein [Streptomyces sp. NBC_00249]MCX5193805.1 hypothetical protein [Streptomyces sp. NBC_00249]